MALNIRNGDTERAVRRLAEVCGLGLTETIDMAVRAQLAARDDSPAAVQARREKVERMSDWLRANVDVASIRHEDDLYDEAGLPR